MPGFLLIIVGFRLRVAFGGASAEVVTVEEDALEAKEVDGADEDSIVV